MRTGIFWFLLAGACGTLGCQAPSRPTEPTVMTLHVTDYDRFVDDTLTLLREFDFQPDRVDRPHGLIVTEPATTKQWYEWWRGDAQTPYDVLEASLHTMRRAVTVTIEPAAQTASEPKPPATETAPAQPVSGSYRVTVQVDKSRYSAPERQVTTTSGALGIYNERLPTAEGLRGAGSRGEYWIPKGRDGALETYLLAKIAALAEP